MTDVAFQYFSRQKLAQESKEPSAVDNTNERTSKHSTNKKSELDSGVSAMLDVVGDGVNTDSSVNTSMPTISPSSSAYSSAASSCYDHETRTRRKSEVILGQVPLIQTPPCFSAISRTSNNNIECSAYHLGLQPSHSTPLIPHNKAELSRPQTCEYGRRNSHHMTSPTKKYDPNELRYIHNTSDGSVYHKRRLLGKGGFARVYEVEQQSFNEETIGMVCAAKVIDKSRLSRPQQREKVEIEIKLLKAARGHPNVVSFHSSFENENVICILLELCNKKSLAQYLRRKQQLCEAEVAAITRQVVSGLAHLHGKGILHRDLKLGNILLTDDMTAKIGDFGLATLVEWGKKKTICGTPNFIAPEVLQRLGHGPEADVWALGCLLYTLLVGKPPFETACLRETYRCILKNSFRIPTTVSAEAADLLRWMLRHKPKTRPTLSEVSSHAFFTKHEVDATPVPPHPSCTTCTTEPTSRPDAQQSPEHTVQPHPAYPTDNPSTENTKQTDKTPTNNELDTTSNISLHDSKSPMRQFAHKIQRRFRVLSPRKCVRAAATTLFDSRKDSERQSNDTDIKPIRKSSATVNMAYQQPQRLASGFAPTWVCKWVDYSNRYGFGYQLANGRICVLFNDGKHIAMLPGGKLIEYASNEQCNAIRFPADSVPLCLERYATMLKSFTNYMDNKLRLNPPLQVNESSSSRLLTWHRTDEFVLMYLNDGTLQVNFCADHCKINVTSIHRRAAMSITYVDQERQTHVYTPQNLTKDAPAYLRTRLELLHDNFHNLFPGAHCSTHPFCGLCKSASSATDVAGDNTPDETHA